MNTQPIPLQEALRDSITSGSFVDIKFWVFSKRTSNSGRVGAPKALFFNERVARRVPRLGTLLDEGKSEENLRTRFPKNKKSYTTNYDYQDDSDLEEDFDEDDSDEEPTIDSPVVTEKLGNDSPDLVTIENSDAKSSRSSDILSVSDLDSVFSEPSDTKDELGHVGKVAFIEDVSFVTFQALLRYLYTNEIEFAPWGSREGRRCRALETVSESYGIPKPSPKSIYRLAHKYDIPELKELALGQIKQDLPSCDIAEEVFSEYTSWYPELRELEIKEFASTLLSGGPGRASRALEGKIWEYTRGELPHAKHAISALYGLIESDKPVEEIPLPVATSSDQQAPSEDWAGLKKALTSSLTSGTFLDSQFYAVESRSSTGFPKSCPVYFSSMVGGSLVSELTACSVKLRSSKALVRCGDGYDSDVEDEEPDQRRSMNCYPRSKCIRENPTPVDLPLDPTILLECGAAKSWTAVLLYVYTGQIAFSPIDSQGATSKEIENDHSEDEVKPAQDREGPGTLPSSVVTVEPCSPKSVYRLADKVGLTGLRDITFRDIQSKLDEKNIVEELFSPFTAEHKDIREMEYELYRSKLKPLVDRTLIHNVIDSSSSGEHPHRWETMALVFERSIQERRERMLGEVNNVAQFGSTSQPKRSTEAPAVPTSPVKPLTPVLTPQPPPQSSPIPVLAPASAGTEVSPDSSTLPEPRKELKVGHLDVPPANTKTNQPPKKTIGFACDCGAIVSKSPGLHGILCTKVSSLKCTGCGARWAGGSLACHSCHGKPE